MAAAMKEKGWNVSEVGYTRCRDLVTPTADLNSILLNTNIKDVAAPGLPEDFAKSKVTKISGPLVLQVQKLRNISAPTARPESNAAPRMFRFSLTDGIQTVTAIEMESLHNVGFETAPGSKLLLKGTVPVNMGILQLTNTNSSMLGGKVTHMLEKWQLNKDLMKISRTSNRADGPPPFIPFGQRMKKEQVQQLSGKFKSLEVANAQHADGAEERDDAEFRAQRKAVISEALQQTTGSKKTYGGIKQTTADEPLQKAEFKKPERKVRKGTVEDKDPNVSDDEDGGGRHRRGGRKGRKGRHGEEEEESLAPSRPSTANTLFDFLGDRLGGKDKQAAQFDSSSHGYNGGYDGRPHTASHNRHGDHRHQSNSSYDNAGLNVEIGHSHRDSRYNNNNTGSRTGNTPVGYNQSAHSNRYSASGTQDRQQRANASQLDSHGGRKHNTKPRSNSSVGYSHRGPNDRPKSASINQGPTLRDGANSTSASQVTRAAGRAQSVTPGKVAGSRDKPLSAATSQNAVSDGRSKGSTISQKAGTNDRPKSASTNRGAASQDSQKPTAGQGMKPNDRSKAPITDQDKRYSGKMYSDDMRLTGEKTNRGGAHRKEGVVQESTGHSTQKSGPVHQPGDVILAKYWEDGQFYRFKVLHYRSPAVLTGVFVDYGNSEEVKVTDTKLISKRSNNRPPQYSVYEGDYTQGLSFSRQPPRQYH